MSQPANVSGQLSANSAEDGTREARTVRMTPGVLGGVVESDPADDVLNRVEAVSQLLQPASDGGRDGDTEGGENADEPSIEQYMAELLARSRDPRPSGRSNTVIMTPEPAEPEVACPADVSDAPAPATAWKQTPPECRDAISEMRELANLSTRATVNVHYAQKLVYVMYNKFIVALMALVISLTLTCLAGDAHCLTFYAALAAMVVAAYWTLQYFQLGRQLREFCGSHHDDA